MQLAQRNPSLNWEPLPLDSSGQHVAWVWWIEPAQSFAIPPMVTAAPTAAIGQQTYASGGAASGSDARSLEAIDSHWGAILQMEVRIASIRKELGGNISRLNSLNRDLNSDERRTCDSKDLQAWTDARRWLRDSISSLSRSVKEIDTGITSGAGQRHKFEEIYRKYVIPKVPFAGVAQSVNEFESYRKTMQNVLSAAQASIAKSGREAESRANAVLTRITAKMRSIRRKD